MADSNTLSFADRQHGYQFGVDGLVDAEEATRLLGNISGDTLERLVASGKVRKGKLPGGRRVFYCRHSVSKLISSIEC